MYSWKHDKRTIRLMIGASAVGIFILLMLGMMIAKLESKPPIGPPDQDSMACSGWAFDPQWGYFNCRKVENEKPSK